MTWTPAKKIINAGVIPDNLMTYCLDATRQREALDWALGSSSAATYKLIKKFSASLANMTTPVYPAIAFSDDNDAQDFTEDIVPAAYSGTFEGSIQNANPDTAVTQAKIYRKAFCSMIANCPDSTLIANTGALSGAVLNTMETGFDPIWGHKKRKNDFLQRFQIRVTYVLHTASR